jgi:hypothetical protein
MKTLMVPAQICVALFAMSSAVMASESFVVTYSGTSAPSKGFASLVMGVTPDALFFTSGEAGLAGVLDSKEKDMSKIDSAKSIRITSEGGSGCKILPIIGPPFKEKLCVTARRSGDSFTLSVVDERIISSFAVSARHDVIIKVQDHSCSAQVNSLSKSVRNTGKNNYVIPKPYIDLSSELDSINASMKCSISE